ncbi:Uncharacterized protein TCM_016358 [Theobroma cacao]|uniref:Uncharacterized protein n=1 Tax=Theobroma cacao TaxID=3641 RepID=A0A061G5L7_THECC|nr:Uncharacterized protein TCM_016358 [Theobroma cacao]
MKDGPHSSSLFLWKTNSPPPSFFRFKAQLFPISSSIIFFGVLFTVALLVPRPRLDLIPVTILATCTFFINVAGLLGRSEIVFSLSPKYSIFWFTGCNSAACEGPIARFSPICFFLEYEKEIF